MKEMQEFEKVMRLYQAEDDGCMYEVGHHSRDEAEQYVKASDYDALLAHTKGLQMRADIVYQHNKELIDKLEDAMKKGYRDAK
jgi:hypothetical protein